MSKTQPTSEQLNALLRYEPETGKLFWKPRGPEWFKSTRQYHTWNTRYAEKEALTSIRRGYRNGTINHNSFLAHRVIWCMVKGEWPDNQIDHIDQDKTNNRMGNLRDVPHSENGKNIPLHCTNTSGASGVIWHKKNKKWIASIIIHGTKKYLGSFATKPAAVAARKAAQAEHGYHPNHGK